ncbi:putative methyltransferase [Nocardia nova SH22a]|uniref:Putative methyltransferase n=1 Tax=Nocardia nova SH22a TaxID=1415166 RepID=W5TWE7_9NOCA|nr:methyltransferase domain-containing protein [Nocardia nova]AHH21496.1 putative methyltransferase [Nocardia nova SH22a]
MSIGDTTHDGPSADETLIRALDAAETLPTASELRAASYELLHLPPAGAVVDIGCGAGCAVSELTRRGYRAVGVDAGAPMIATARHRWPGADFRIGDATSLPLESDSMHGYRADKVFHELADPAAVLAEARRVLKPGGRIVLLGQDWDALIIDSDRPELTRTVVAARADAITNPRAARRYRNTLLDNGFTEVSVEVRTGICTDARMLPMLTRLADTAAAVGATTPDEAAGWIAEQTRRCERDRLLLAVPMFLAAGTLGRDVR